MFKYSTVQYSTVQSMELVALTAGINLLKPSGFSPYHQVENSKILHGARFVLSVLYLAENKQRLLLYTSLTDWFL